MSTPELLIIHKNYRVTGIGSSWPICEDFKHAEQEKMSNKKKSRLIHDITLECFSNSQN